jgi:hypothetical protein
MGSGTDDPTDGETTKNREGRSNCEHEANKTYYDV